MVKNTDFSLRQHTELYQYCKFYVFIIFGVPQCLGCLRKFSTIFITTVLVESINLRWWNLLQGRRFCDKSLNILSKCATHFGLSDKICSLQALSIPKLIIYHPFNRDQGCIYLVEEADSIQLNYWQIIKLTHKLVLIFSPLLCIHI